MSAIVRANGGFLRAASLTAAAVEDEAKAVIHTQARLGNEVATVQALYYIATGVAPFVSRRTFEAVTGPKTDWWLVQTVGALVSILGGALLHSAVARKVTTKDRLIAISVAAGLGAIESANAIRRRISRVYLLDALLQACFISAWALTKSDGHS